VNASSFLSCAICALLGSGCAAESRPPDVLREYAEALSQGDTRAAYSLLSAEARQALPFAAFERIVRESPDEAREISKALRQPVESSYVTTTITGPGGCSVLLVYEDGEWRIDASSIDLYSQSSPEAAVASFVRAFENKRYDVLLRFVPVNKREGLDAAKLKTAWEGEQQPEMQRLTRVLKASLPTAHTEQLGDRATLRYGAGATVELVREQGLWRVEEF
jgi:hypothetical protein